MKTMKKMFALLLAVVMVMSLSVTAFAASDGSITISNATVGQTYVIYKVFDLTYSDSYKEATYAEDSSETYYTKGSDGGYTEATDPANTSEQLYVKVTNVSYTITATSKNSALISALQGEGTVFTLTASDTNSSVYVVTLKSNYAQNEDGDNITATDDQVIAYVKSIADKLGDAVNTTDATDTTVTFSGLDYGYYYITSTLGTLVTIDSTLKDVTVQDKNEGPDANKEVKEDSTGELGEKNTADIGDKVEYTTTITAKPGAENYVLHDTMTEGLTFNNDIVVKAGKTALTAYTEGATSWDYKVVTPGTETGENVTACTFEVVFNQTYLDTITETAENPTTIVVSYSATVNDKAVIDDTGNTNKTHLSYGENNNISTTEKTTTTYVFDVDILKYTAGENDTEKTPLSGAEFVLYKTVDGTKYYAKVTEGKLTGWTKNSSSTCKEDSGDAAYAATLTSGTDGKISVDGLDADTYYLEETKAPDGYNLLGAAVKIKIDDEGNVYVDDSSTAATNGLVEVENKTGTELPSTGGIGTTIFYVVGSILAVGAAVLLITKKRMNKAEDQ